MSAGALTRRGLLLAVTGLSLYLLAPALLEVFGAFDELNEIAPLWFPAMVLLQAGSFACMWGVQHLAVRADRWGPGDHVAAGVERVRPHRAGRRGRLGRAAVLDAGARGRAGRRGRLGDDRLVAAPVRHPPRPPAARAARRARRSRRRSSPHARGAGRRRALRADGRPGRGVHRVGQAADRRRPRRAGDPQPAAQGAAAARRAARAPPARARHRRPRAREGVVEGSHPRLGPLAARTT